MYGKDNHEDETMEFHDDIMITPVRIIGLLLLLAGDPLLPFQLDDGDHDDHGDIYLNSQL